MNCPTCRKVWLDRGELDKIIDRSHGSAPAQAAPGSPAPGYDPGSPPPGSGGSGKRKKRRGFLDDIFDF